MTFEEKKPRNKSKKVKISLIIGFFLLRFYISQFFFNSYKIKLADTVAF